MHIIIDILVIIGIAGLYSVQFVLFAPAQIWQQNQIDLLKKQVEELQEKLERVQ